MPVVVAAGNVYRTRFWPRSSTPRLLAGAMLLSGALLTAPFAWLLEGAEGMSLLNGGLLSAVTAAAVIIFIAQYLFFFHLQNIAGPVYLSQIGSVAAIFGGLFAVVVFGEVLPAGFGWATLCIAAGVGLFQLSSHLDRPK